MHYLGLALYAEGPTDYYFLSPLLQRLAEEICLRRATQPVEVTEVLGLDHPAHLGAAPREERILAAGRAALGMWRILFVHADGAGDPQHAHHTQVQPALTRLAELLPAAGEGIAVIPVRETEAWTIADGDALRRVFGATLDDGAMGLSVSRAVESVADPKAILHGAFMATHPSPRRRKQGVSPMLNALGEQVALERLRQLPAFSALELELTQALQRLRIIA